MQHLVPQSLNLRIIQRLLTTNILITRRVARNQCSFPQQREYIHEAPLPGKLVDFAQEECGWEAGKGVLLFLAVGWVLIDTVWYLIIVSILHTIRGWLSRPRVRPALEKLSGGVLLALGVRLVLDPR
jgi:hypothetical protein